MDDLHLHGVLHQKKLMKMKTARTGANRPVQTSSEDSLKIQTVHRNVNVAPTSTKTQQKKFMKRLKQTTKWKQNISFKAKVRESLFFKLSNNLHAIQLTSAYKRDVFQVSGQGTCCPALFIPFIFS